MCIPHRLSLAVQSLSHPVRALGVDEARRLPAWRSRSRPWMGVWRGGQRVSGGQPSVRRSAASSDSVTIVGGRRASRRVVRVEEPPW